MNPFVTVPQFPQFYCHGKVWSNNSPLTCVDLEGAACMTEEDLGIHLEEWEGSEEKPDAPSISAMEDSLHFESKNII